MPTLARRVDPGLSLEGSSPCVLTRDPMYTNGPGTHDGVFNLAPSIEGHEDRSSDGVEPGHTSRPRGRSKSAHAVEFSKTVAPLQEGDSFPGRVQDRLPISERTGEYSARPAPRWGSGRGAGSAGRKGWPCLCRPADAETLAGRRGRRGQRAGGGKGQRAGPEKGRLASRKSAAAGLRQNLDRDRPLTRAVVEVDEHHLLPGAQREAPIDHRNRL